MQITEKNAGAEEMRLIGLKPDCDIQVIMKRSTSRMEATGNTMLNGKNVVMEDIWNAGYIG